MASTAPIARRRRARYLIVLGALILLLGLWVDVSDTIHYPGADLRPRTVGYRLAASGRDPYEFRWVPGMSDRLVDPYLPSGLSLTRTVVTPTCLLVQAPLDALSYRGQRVAWLVVQWALLLGLFGLGWLWLTGDDRWAFLAVGVLFVAGSYFWRLHVERGQTYVLYAFVFALVYECARRRSTWGDVVAGLVLGLAIALRPTYALALIPLIIARKWLIVLGGVVGAAAAAAAPALLFHASIWSQYARAMAAQGRQYLRYFGPPPATKPWYPRVVEGRSYWSTRDIPTIDASVAKIAHHAGVTLTPAMLDAGLLLAVVALTALFWVAGRGRLPRLAVIVLQGGVLAYIAEFFLAATRFSYRDVMLVPLVALLLVSLGATRLRASRWTVVGLAGLVLGCVSVVWLPGGPDYTVFAGEALTTVSLIALTCVATRAQAPLSGGEFEGPAAKPPAPATPSVAGPEG